MLKETIEAKYGSINKFIDTKIKELGGQLPFSREHIYRIICHEIQNPGIKTLKQISELAEVPLSDVVAEWTE